MKKTFFLAGVGALMVSLFATGCITATGDERLKKANEFITESQSYKEHEVQQDMVVNGLLLTSQSLYMTMGGALSDTIKIMYGEADAMLLAQTICSDMYQKSWDALMFAGDDDASKKDAEAAKAELLDAINEYMADPVNKSVLTKTKDQYFDILANKRALQSFIDYKKALKEAGDNKAQVEESFKAQMAWLEKGKQELNNSYGDEYRKAAAERERILQETRLKTIMQLEQLTNKSAYLGLFVADLGSDLAISQAPNEFAKSVLAKAKAATIKKMLELEAKYPYVKEATVDIMKLASTDAQIEYGKKLIEQYGYAIKMAGGRVAYTAKGIPWYFAAKEDFDLAAGE